LDNIGFGLILRPFQKVKEVNRLIIWLKYFSLLRTEKAGGLNSGGIKNKAKRYINGTLERRKTNGNKT